MKKSQCFLSVFMGVVLVSSVLLGVAVPAFAGLKYECWTYKNNKPYKMTYIVANNNDEAVELVREKFHNIGVTNYDYIICK